MSISGVEGRRSCDACCDHVMLGDVTTLSHRMIKHEKSSITKMLSEVVCSEV